MWQGRRVFRGLGGLLVALLLFAALPAGQVFAAPPVINCADSGAGSLRAAITAAAVGDTITFGAGLNCPSGAGTQITLTSGTLTIAQNNLTIDATGHTIVVDGNSAVTVFTVTGGTGAQPVTLKGLTIQHGHAPGAIVGGGIRNGGTLVVTNSTFSSNVGFRGGAIHTVGALTVTNSIFANNMAVGGGGNTGGGINEEGAGTVAITNSAFVNNSAAGGGAIEQGAGTLTVTNTTFASNTATGGGAIEQSGISALTVTNSTFSGNTSSTFGGSAILRDDDGAVTVTNSTFSGNSTTTGGALFDDNSGPLTLRNTIITGNTGGNCATALGGTISDGGHNLQFGDSSCGATIPTQNPQLGPLMDNSGTPATVLPDGTHATTFAITTASPAFNHGDPAICTAPLPPTGTGAGSQDERGFPRGNGSAGNPTCSIGSFEPPTITIGPTVLPNGTVDTPYSQSLTASGGTAPYTFTITSGSLPPGLTLSTAGIVTGTPTQSGSFPFAVTATDASSATGSQAFTLIIAGLQFYPLAKPVRLLDTRAGSTAFVTPNAPLSPGQTLPLPGQFTYQGVTIPPSAQAIVGNATVANGSNGTPAGFATIFPSGVPQPLTSNLNFVPGTVRPNNFTVALGADTKFNLFSSSGGDFVIDISGYYAPVGAGGLYFHPLSAPVRELDTRVGATAAVTPGRTLGAGETLTLPGSFTFNSITVPASAKALVGNATVANNANGTPAGFATLYPDDVPLPLASNLNFVPGTVAPNAFTVALGGGGGYNLYTSSGGDFIIDITGYLDTTAAGGLLFTPLSAPVRELDTRAGATAFVTPNATLTAGQTLTLPGSFTFNSITVPAGAQALVGNATVANNANSTPAGFATLYPDGVALPLASNLNFVAKQVAPNAMVVGVGGDGKYNLYTSSGGDFIIDISGYFAAPGGAAPRPVTAPAKATVPTAPPTATKPTK